VPRGCFPGLCDGLGRSLSRPLWSAAGCAVIVAGGLTLASERCLRAIPLSGLDSEAVLQELVSEPAPVAKRGNVQEKIEAAFLAFEKVKAPSLPSDLTAQWLNSWTLPVTVAAASPLDGLAVPDLDTRELQISSAQPPLPRSRLTPNSAQAEAETWDRKTSSPQTREPATSVFAFVDRLFQLAPKPLSPYPAQPGGHTAVYDIESHAVYMPDGEILEAHSGLGELMDDVRYVHQKSRGPTPPNEYALSLRKALFHGVRAIRLTPVGKANMFGRDGILAHSYMLGPNGQSNGCVSIQNYDKFLEAYLQGKIDRLVVIANGQTAPAENLNADAGDPRQDPFRPI
jgi:hypothetical protein